MACKKGQSPRVFSQALFDGICERIAAGESLRSICASTGMPAKGTFFRWVADDEKLAAQYANAQNLRAEHYFDEIVEIADKTTDPQKGRLQVDARKWVLACMNPKKYGDKMRTEHVGEGGGPIQMVGRIELVALRDDDSSDGPDRAS
ncbi:hypothetical protein WJ95_09435 [Burkholderia ubonensis]|uniref:terminase small subunit-like protein n=1 Tax=Burkholderia ubonensis TaxID=101571 RepID=UPI00075A647B|nr:hypothetical protein [Burkholderia ubonensis]KVP90719.1 hypothetical protein WJ95_09435 [Burkholderia ubonensis]